MEVDIQDRQVILTGVKVTLVMSKEEFIACLKRGKSHARQQAMQVRLTRLAQEPRSVTGLGG